MTSFRPLQQQVNKSRQFIPSSANINDILNISNSYYLLPVLSKSEDETTNRVIDRIIDDVKRGSTDYTDVIIFSHGWHRHLWQAISAYGRLITRLKSLNYAGRASSNRNRKFEPLYIAVHWHSEVGKNIWTGGLPLKDKTSFTKKVNEHFIDNGYWRRSLIIDQIFELFTFINVLGDENTRSKYVVELTSTLNAEIDYLKLISSNSTDSPAKMEILWRCYSESDDLKSPTDQRESIQEFIEAEVDENDKTQRSGQLQRQLSLIRTLIIIGLIICCNLSRCYELFVFLTHRPAMLIISMVASGLINFYTTFINYLIKTPKSRKSKVSSINDAFLISSLILFSIPLLIWMFFTFVFGPLLTVFPRHSHEKVETERRYFRKLGYLRSHLPSISFILAEFGYLPITLWHKIMPEMSLRATIAEKAQSQLSFWRMQHRAPCVGVKLANILNYIYRNCDGKLDNSKLHLIGHSFGASVVANAAREISMMPQSRIKCASLCLLLPAMHDKWLKREPALRSMILETLSCVYSKHDSANGRYYPIANQGRLSAGYHGFIGIDEMLDQVASPAMSLPPSLNPEKEKAKKQLINLNATLLMNQGNLATGGAHNDLFKDEVLMLIWSLTVGASVHINDPIYIPQTIDVNGKENVKQEPDNIANEKLARFISKTVLFAPVVYSFFINFFKRSKTE